LGKEPCHGLTVAMGYIMAVLIILAMIIHLDPPIN
jgi:hypothetical protein